MARQRLALRHWSNQAIQISTAALQNQVKKLDMLHLANLFDVNVDAEIEHRHWRMRCIFEAWQIGCRQLVLERQQLAANPTSKLLSVSVAPRQVRAQRRLIRWHRVFEEPLSVLPVAFAAWTLITVEANLASHARGLADQAASTRSRYRLAAERLLRRRGATLQRLQLVARAFAAFVAGRSRQRRASVVARLCSGVDLLTLRRTLLQWSQLLHFRWKLRASGEKRTFEVQAKGLAARLLRFHGSTHSFISLAIVWTGWRSWSLRNRPLLRLRLERLADVQQAAVRRRFCRELFHRWFCTAYRTRRELLLNPMSVVFTAWKAARGPRVPQLELLPSSSRQIEVASSPPEEGARGGWRSWLRQTLAQRRQYRWLRRRRYTEAALALRGVRQAFCFTAWRLRCRLRRLAPRLLARSPGLRRAAFEIWAQGVERRQLASLTLGAAFSSSAFTPQGGPESRKLEKWSLFPSSLRSLACAITWMILDELRLRLTLHAWSKLVAFRCISLCFRLAFCFHFSPLHAFIVDEGMARIPFLK
ncbi:unnamed protein product, partial [Symbiodinium microadriaticum]